MSTTKSNKTYDTTLTFIVDNEHEIYVNVRFIIDTRKRSWKVLDLVKNEPLNTWWFDYDDFRYYLMDALDLTDTDYGICILNKNYEQARDPVNEGFYRIGECRL